MITFQRVYAGLFMVRRNGVPVGWLDYRPGRLFGQWLYESNGGVLLRQRWLWSVKRAVIRLQKAN